MQIYCAPMEGITGAIFRSAHHALFSCVDRYYTPFLCPGQRTSFTGRDKRDVAPENNRGVPLVPQLLTNHAMDFVGACRYLESLGYDEVNLNLGCPSGTVVAKNRGAGFLRDPDALSRFFDVVFAGMHIKVSVKTRLGLLDAAEFSDLLDVYNQYPICELIIHPRVQRDQYRNHPNLAVFGEALARSRAPVCYNGDLFSPEDVQAFAAQFPSVKAIMLGRGLIANPALGELICKQGALDAGRFLAFHERLLQENMACLSGDRSLLFRMKDLWGFWRWLFPAQEKAIKAIYKSQHLTDYRSAVNALLQTAQPQPRGAFGQI
ncbi:MAG: tRNA-dihydrouridine synthase family protein [Oscillospiraceae bacterium]|nr:tRNA-dihydrouridine synthase family protein [Oscillospiraceae bacterium]